MSITALVLVLLAALIHATWNYHLKKANAGRALWLLVYIFTTLISIPALVIADPECFSRITPTGWLVICISAPVHTLYAVTLQHRTHATVQQQNLIFHRSYLPFFLYTFQPACSSCSLRDVRLPDDPQCPISLSMISKGPAGRCHSESDLSSSLHPGSL